MTYTVLSGHYKIGFGTMTGRPAAEVHLVFRKPRLFRVYTY